VYTGGLSSGHWANLTDADTLIAIAEHMAAAAAQAYNRMPRGLSRAQIEQLGSYRWPASNVETQHCVVCMCDVQTRQTVRCLPCNHIYHARCIDKWLKTNRTCPVCRHDASTLKPDPKADDTTTTPTIAAGPSTRV